MPDVRHGIYRLGFAARKALGMDTSWGSFHLSAGFVALANVANTDVPAIADDVLPRTNGHLFPSRDLKLIQAYASAVTLVRARLTTPKTRNYGFHYLDPINAALLPPDIPPVADYRDMPFQLNREEEVTVELTDSAAGPNNAYWLLWLADHVNPIAGGDIFTIRGTSTTAAVAQAWTSLVVALDVNLPQGTYQVCGLAVESTNAIAARLIFENQIARPGTLSRLNSTRRTLNKTRRGHMGLYGSFRTNSLPQVQVLCDAADAAHTIYMDVLRVG